jgi:NRAMP (natural resistance-associated macrophage protein)-like metal ion transporter
MTTDAAQAPAAAPASARGVRGLLGELGPGLITGAADDDPSGIATYSQAGASFGYGLLWTALLCMPLMAAVQTMCARIGVVAERGLASVLREYYARWLLWLACSLLFVGNTINIAADLGGMGAAAELLTGARALWFVPAFTVLILALLVFATYQRMTRILKWLALVLFAYVAAAFFAHPDWHAVAAGTFIPRIQLRSDYLLMFVAILGTTISPYLFFWQAAQNAEQEVHASPHVARRRRSRWAVRHALGSASHDVNTGMFISQAIMYFIILTTGATLHSATHSYTIDTAAQAAAALRPLAGEGATVIFALGLVGTGLLGVPVLAGSAAYALGEAGAWRTGMDETPRSAAPFYGVMAAAMVVGMVLALAHINAMKLLLWSAVVNGLLAPPLVIIILIICNNATVMGAYRNGRTLNILGGLVAVMMSGAAIALIVSWLT